MSGWLQRLVTLPRAILPRRADSALLLAAIAARNLAHEYDDATARADSSAEGRAG